MLKNSKDSMDNISLFETKTTQDYELIDSGEGEKLERYGAFVLARPDPQVLWQKKSSKDVWKKADAHFVPGEGGKSGGWKSKIGVPSWSVNYSDLEISFKVSLSPFKHTGLFPEQYQNWKWIKEKIVGAGRPISVLNLFGYSGGATTAALSAGASVVHVDASKSTIAMARENAALSGLSDKPVRWILDDAVKFVEREIRRGNHYDAIVMDPPAFGHGAKGEVWKIENDFVPLFQLVQKLFSEKPLFLIVSGYAAGFSSIAYQNNMLEVVARYGGNIESGELAIRESGLDGRLLPCGIVARWHA